MRINELKYKSFILDLIGYSGSVPRVAQFHPYDPKIIIYPIGGFVVIENVDDKHN